MQGAEIIVIAGGAGRKVEGVVNHALGCFDCIWTGRGLFFGGDSFRGGHGADSLVAALAAWAGYTAIGAAMLVIGAPARAWVQRKLRLSTEPDPKRIWRIWQSYGLPGLGPLAPVTIVLFCCSIGFGFGEKPRRVLFWVAFLGPCHGHRLCCSAAAGRRRWNN